jgi:hypothetical protein
MQGANYYGIDPTWHYGYPQPEDDFGFLEATYDLSGYCSKCAVGARQNEPFRMKKEPVWGRRSFLQLNWVFDEYFTKPEIWQKHFEPFGIGYREVVLHKNGAVLDSVVQLDIPAIADVELINQQYEICDICHSKKYHPRIVGFYPRPETTHAEAFKSSAYFGSGSKAFRQVFISQAVFAPIYAAGLKGIEFSPCNQR